MDDSKVSSILQWPVPQTVKELRGFLGLTGYYRRFIQHYGLVCKPLTELLRKDSFNWCPQAQTAFEHLKRLMCSAPVLSLPDFKKAFVLETDASGGGIGAVLMQEGHPIAFLSKALSTKNLGLSVYEKELLALVMAVTKWRHYLVGSHFIIRTDHQSLKYLLDQKLNTALQHKWMTKLMGMDYEIQYKRGTENLVADALSRRQEAVGDSPLHSCLAITAVRPVWMEELQKSYEGDDHCQNIMAQLILDPNAHTDYTMVDGMLRYQGKLYVGSANNIRNQVIQVLHASAIGGHSGQNSCWQKVRSLFHWPGMKQEVVTFIRNCDTCQRNKSENVLYPGLLQPIPVPTQAWTHIAMDFIEKLPKSQGYDTIVVVIDRFTKFGHFIRLSHPFTAKEVALAFLDNIYRMHGLPESIITDRDKVFTSGFWKELFKVMGTELHYTSSYHPQSDGQSERLNQCVENYLRCMTGEMPSQWSKWLSMAEWWYNSTYHSSLQMTPFEALFGYKPVPLPLGHYLDSVIPAASNLLQERNRISNYIRDNLATAQQRMNYFADHTGVRGNFQ